MFNQKFYTFDILRVSHRLTVIKNELYSTLTTESGGTVFALSSGIGRCGVAVVRVSGPATSLAIRLLSKPTARQPKPRVATLTRFYDPGTRQQIDQGILLWFPKPQSFTGEDCAEFHIHGGNAVIKALLTALAKIPNVRLAEAGEFTKRAFLNGKLELTEVEGLSDLLHAETESQHQQALRQMQGELGKLYQQWKQALLKCAANVEAYIDFSEDDNIEADVLDEARNQIQIIKNQIRNHLNDNRRGELLRDGVQVALLGEPNVGKSSLLNIICQRPAAIVSSIAGTTRDVIESFHNIGGYPVTFCDTAGLRQTTNLVELEGVRRAVKRGLQADIVILMLDAVHQYNKFLETPKMVLGDYISEQLETLMATTNQGQSQSPLDSGQRRINLNDVVVVFNKLDLVDKSLLANLQKMLSSPGTPSCCAISCLNQDGLTHFLDTLVKKIKQRCGDPSVGNPSLTQQRHRVHLTQCVHHLGMSLHYFNHDEVLVAEQLRRALRQLGKIVGQFVNDDILNVLFKDFCIGK